MVVGTSETKRTDALSHALADPTRRDILAVVLRDPHSVSDLARLYPISFAARHIPGIMSGFLSWRERELSLFAARAELG